ncbi:MarP family serine protease [Streptomyces sp. NPDC048219]|uniref:MarP family serine protease n=1 Tax=Streptomyces sp. NPDC048219 TaxID=3365517 RepID=UPI0037160869
MTFLDLLVLIAVLLCAASGYRRGFAATLVTLTLAAAGALLGLALLPWVLSRLGADVSAAAVNTATLCTVLGPAMLGTVAAGRPVRRLRGRLPAHGPLRWADAAGGAAAGGAVLLGAVWVAGNAALGSSYTSPAVRQDIRESTTMTVLADRLPARTAAWVGRASGMLTDAGLPEVLNPFQSEPATGVPAPTGDSVTQAATQAAQRSTVKITGPIGSTGRSSEGSGFVYGDELVLTNAHVVAGVDRPTVQAGGVGSRLSATVVRYSPGIDAAVLRVPGLDAPTLSSSDLDAGRGKAAVVAGYPEGGALDLRAARVATRMNTSGLDIYDEVPTTRDVYQLRTIVRPGNSGGPLLTTDGQVYGMVFARSTAHPGTGYALTADQLRSFAQQGAQADEPLETRPTAA